MTSARSIIEQATRKISVLGRGTTLSADEANDALTALNNLLGKFSAESGTIINTVRETFPLTGAASYTIGIGGNFNTQSPISITAMFITIGGTDYTVTPISAEDYANIPQKTISGTPDLYSFEDNYPLGRIFLYPVGVSGYILNLWSRKALTRFADLTTDYDLADGVENMLVFNLAVILAPEYEKEASDTVKREARSSKSAVEAMCRRNSPPTSTIDIAGSPGASGNIFSGYNTR